MDGGHNVILRPHPQSWKSDKKLLIDVISTFSPDKNFTIDKETKAENSIRKTRLLICDITSGMVFDVAFVYRKPIVGIEFNWADGGYEASELPNDSAAIDLLNDIGAVVTTSELKDISDIVNTASTKTITQEIIDKHIYNFQNAGKVAAKQILSIFKEVNKCS